MDLKSFREDKLKIKTQSAFAELIDVDQSSISRWEKDPDNIPFQIIQKILEKTGATYEELTGWKKPIPEPLNVKNTWEKANFTKYTLSDYIYAALEDTNLPDEYKKSYIEDLRYGITANLVKPKVAIVGRSDTGKSTLINSLLGIDKMPTSWTPTTSIAVYIKHIDDKPAFIEEDAWVFANQVGTENLWDERRLDDENYCRNWKIAAGGVEILNSFGTRQGENYSKGAGSAIVFVDAPILKICDIIDLPGYGTETESDDNITFETSQKADIMIYLSQANGFMRIEDINYLKRNINELPVWEKKDENSLKPLSNLFIVASQAHTINNGNRVELKEILDVGCANLTKTLTSNYWDKREKLSGYNYIDNGAKELRSRFFAYTIDILDICTPFNEALTEVLELLPESINNRAKAYVRNYIEARKPNLINELQKYEGIVAERDRYVTLISEIEKNELSRIKDNDKRKQEIKNKIDSLATESKKEFCNYISETINIDALVGLMKEKGVKNKKKDIELFGSTLQSMVQERCEEVITDKSNILSENTKEYITSYSNSISKPFEKNSINVDFDASWAFASALSTIGVIGGFGGFLASTISGVLVFTSIGLGFGSSIMAGIVTSSIFGPIGMAVGIVIAAGLGIAKLFGGGWEKNVAKKIIKTFDDNKIREQFTNGIELYWKQTDEAFDKASDKLDEEWEAYVENLRKTVKNYDIQEIQHKIASLNYLSDFFENIPL